MMASSNETLVAHSPLFPPHSPINSPSASLKSPSLHGRHHSLSSSSSLHRVSRRKSATSSATNLAAVAQAVKDSVDASFTILAPPASLLSKSMGNRSTILGNGGINQVSGLPTIHGYPSPPSSLPSNGAGPLSNIGPDPPGGFTFPRKSPVTPDNGPSTLSNGISDSTNNGLGRRTRRASEGAYSLCGGSSERESGGRGSIELKCEKCGKGYKHSSCLTKHLWEHTPEWQITSKLLISKHQQVQLLEAASILVSMKPNESTPAPSTASSAASINEYMTGNSSSSGNSSSEDTTPPPDYPSPLGEMDATSPFHSTRSIRVRPGSKRYSSSSSITGNHSSIKLSSYHSHAPPILSGSVPTHINSGSSFPNHFISKTHNGYGRQRSGSFVNTSRVAAIASTAADDESLAAAVGLLSCSFGTTAPISTPITTPQASWGLINLPALNFARTENGTTHASFLEQFRKQARKIGASDGDVVMKIEETEEEDSGWPDRYNNFARSNSADEMAIDDDDDYDDEWTRASVTMRRRIKGIRRSRSEEDEDGVFGRMEE